jgi:Cof subfamily protein (haloacid dehalogenase superfamily)
MNKMKTLFVSDLDGTLLNKKSQLSKYTINKINALIDKGVLFTYATARSFASSESITKELKIIFPVITNNGTFIVDPKTNKKYCEMFFIQKENNIIKKCLIKNNINPLVYSYNEENEKVSWLKNEETDMIKKYKEDRKNDKRLNPINDIRDLYKGNIFQYTIIEPKEKLIDAYEYLYSINNYTITFQQELYQEEYLFEITNKQANKGNALLKLKDVFGIDKIISFGDSNSDISMFKASDECYIVKNGSNELKQYATGIIESNENNGVAKWLNEKLL